MASALHFQASISFPIVWFFSIEAQILFPKDIFAQEKILSELGDAQASQSESIHEWVLQIRTVLR